MTVVMDFLQLPRDLSWLPTDEMKDAQLVGVVNNRYAGENSTYTI
jgi:hypothetical protein